MADIFDQVDAITSPKEGLSPTAPTTPTTSSVTGATTSPLARTPMMEGQPTSVATEPEYSLQRPASTISALQPAVSSAPSSPLVRMPSVSSSAPVASAEPPSISSTLSTSAVKGGRGDVFDQVDSMTTPHPSLGRQFVESVKQGTAEIFGGVAGWEARAANWVSPGSLPPPEEVKKGVTELAGQYMGKQELPEAQGITEHVVRGAGGFVPQAVLLYGIGRALGPVLGLATKLPEAEALINSPRAAKFLEQTIRTFAGGIPAAEKTSRIASMTGHALRDAVIFGTQETLLNPEDATKAGVQGAAAGLALGAISPLNRVVRIITGGGIGALQSYLGDPNAKPEAHIASAILMGVFSAFGRNPKQFEAELQKTMSAEEAARVAAGLNDARQKTFGPQTFGPENYQRFDEWKQRSASMQYEKEQRPQWMNPEEDQKLRAQWQSLEDLKKTVGISPEQNQQQAGIEQRILKNWLTPEEVRQIREQEVGEDISPGWRLEDRGRGPLIGEEGGQPPTGEGGKGGEGGGAPPAGGGGLPPTGISEGKGGITDVEKQTEKEGQTGKEEGTTGTGGNGQGQTQVESTPTGPVMSTDIPPETVATLTPKEQKAHLIDQINTAIKGLGKAAEGKGEDYTFQMGPKTKETATVQNAITFEVPGDGTFRIPYTRDALAKFRDQVRLHFPENAKMEPAGIPAGYGKAGALRSRITGEGVAYYNDYRQKTATINEMTKSINSEVKSGKNPWAGINEDGFLTDGRMALLPKEKVAVGKDVPTDLGSLNSYFAENSSPAELFEYSNMNDPEAFIHAVGKDGTEASYNPKYVDRIMTEYPNAEISISAGDRVLTFRDGGKNVGLIMPFAERGPDAELRGRTEAKGGEPPKTEPPKTELKGLAEQITKAINEKPSGPLQPLEKILADRLHLDEANISYEIPRGQRLGLENDLFAETQQPTGKLGGDVRQTGEGKIGRSVFEVDRPYGKLIYDEATGELKVERPALTDEMARKNKWGMGADLELLIPTLSKDIVNNDLPGTLANETIQNALDALSLMPKGHEGKVKVHIDPYENYTLFDGNTVSAVKVTVEDNGVGMTAKEMQNYLLKLGAKGKSGTDTSGGYGLAKASFMIVPIETRVESVKDGKLTDLIGTRWQFMGAKGHGEVPEPVVVPSHEPTGTKFTFTFFKDDSEAKNYNAMALDDYRADKAFMNYLSEKGVRKPGIDFTYSRSYGDEHKYQSKGFEGLPEAFKTEKFSVAGNKGSVYFTPDDNPPKQPSWDRKFYPNFEIFNKGLGLPRIVSIGAHGLHEAPDWKIVVNFEKTAPVSSLDYPFISNRTQISDAAIKPIRDAINNKIDKIANDQYQGKKKAFSNMVKNSPEIEGVKVLIPFEDPKDFANAKKLIEDNRGIVKGMVDLFTSFKHLLKKIGEDDSTMQFAITVDPKIHGFRSNPAVTGHEFHAINPFAITFDLMKDKAYEKQLGEGYDSKVIMAANMAHTLVHEYAHRVNDYSDQTGHGQAFTTELSRLYRFLSHGQLSRLEAEARSFYDQHGETLAGLQNHFELYRLVRSKFRQNNLSVSAAERGREGSVRGVEEVGGGRAAGESGTAENARTGEPTGQDRGGGGSTDLVKPSSSETIRNAVEVIDKGTEGECFRNAIRYAMNLDDPNSVIVVHGKVTNAEGKTFDHAWVERGNRVIDPTTGVNADKATYYRLAQAEPEASYTGEQAAINSVRIRNMGPWTPKEVGDRQLWRADSDIRYSIVKGGAESKLPVKPDTIIQQVKNALDQMTSIAISDPGRGGIKYGNYHAIEELVNRVSDFLENAGGMERQQAWGIKNDLMQYALNKVRQAFPNAEGMFDRDTGINDRSRGIDQAYMDFDKLAKSMAPKELPDMRVGMQMKGSWKPNDYQVVFKGRLDEAQIKSLAERVGKVAKNYGGYSTGFSWPKEGTAESWEHWGDTVVRFTGVTEKDFHNAFGKIAPTPKEVENEPVKTLLSTTPEGGPIRPVNWTLDDVQRTFPGQKVTMGDDGTFSVELNNGKAILIDPRANIIINPETSMREYGQSVQPGDLIAGRWQHFGYGGIIELTKDATPTTLRHETLHAAMDLALTPEENTTLLRKYGDHESIAEAYEKWNPADRSNSLFAKIYDFFVHLKDLLFTGKWQTTDDIVRKISEGKTWGEPVATGDVFRRVSDMMEKGGPTTMIETGTPLSATRFSLVTPETARGGELRPWVSDMENSIKQYMPDFSSIKSVLRWAKSNWAPGAISEQTLAALNRLRGHYGEFEQLMAEANTQTKEERRFFSRQGVGSSEVQAKMPDDQNPGIQFMEREQRGEEQPTEELRNMHTKIRGLLDRALDGLDRAGVPLEEAERSPNYFPGVYTRPSIRALNQSLSEFLSDHPDFARTLYDENGAPIGRGPAMADWPQEYKDAVRNRVDQLLTSGEGLDGNLASELFSRRPLQGPEGFRKEKIFKDLATAREFGLEFLSNNPIDQVMTKIREIGRSAMAHGYLNEERSLGNVVTVSNGGIIIDPKSKKPVVDANGNAVPVDRTKYTTVPGALREIYYRDANHQLVKAGDNLATVEVAKVLDNFMSKTPYSSELGPLYSLYMKIGSLLNQSQLGMLSMFHGGAMTIQSYNNGLANVVTDLWAAMHGKRSAADLRTSFVHFLGAPFFDNRMGAKLLSERFNPTLRVEDSTVVPGRLTADNMPAYTYKALQLAGGKMEMDPELRTHAGVKWMDAYYSKDRLAMLKNSPTAFTEALAYPIMTWLVPRMKMGVFAEKVARVIADNPGKTMKELQPEFNRAYNVVEGAMGQVGYNRLAMNGYAKGAVQALIRAPGWSGGTLALLGGGIKDMGNFMRQWKKDGKAPEILPDRIAYVLGEVLGAAVTNAILTAAFTGSQPKGMDFWAFRTGNKDEYGRDERFVLPSYMKDIIAYTQHPGNTLVNKTHPMIGMINEAFRTNKDYYGVEIRSKGAPVISQVEDLALYGIKQFSPFWMRGAAKEIERGEGTLGAQLTNAPQKVLAPLIGLMPAPAEYNKSAAERLMTEMGAEQRASGAMTKEQRTKFDLENQIRRDFMTGNKFEAESRLQGAIQEGVLSKRDAANLRKVGALNENPFTYSFQRLNAEDALRVWAVASDEEKEAAQPILLKKMKSLIVNASPQKRNELLPKFREAIGQ